MAGEQSGRVKATPRRCAADSRQHPVIHARRRGPPARRSHEARTVGIREFDLVRAGCYPRVRLPNQQEEQMTDSIAWFVDGAYIFESWREVAGGAPLDYTKFRNRLETLYCQAGQVIDEAYYFTADQDPPSAARNGFHTFLTHRPPTGPGLRVKLYWLSRRTLSWPRQMGGGPVLHPTMGTSYELVQQKGVDVGLAFNLMLSFNRRKWKTLLLGAGDGDFHEVVQHLVEHENVRVIGLGLESNTSTELRPYFSDLFSLKTEVANLTRSTP